jgi:hypothetical protein
LNRDSNAGYPANVPHRIDRSECANDNIDTGCLSALDDTAVFGTVDGDVYLSEDAGSTRERAASGLPPVRAVEID